MNVMLASGNYPWTVIKLDNREQYMSALEKASVGNDIKDFAKFIGEQVSNTIDKKTGSMLDVKS
jgi:hypothetical protein